MAKKFGRRGKKSGGGQGAADPRELFGPPPPQRYANPPASSTPLADYLSSRALPGVDSGYVVLPRSLAESMSLPWQQHLVQLLAQFHNTHAGLSWPVYRVVPSRYERLVDLDEEQLAEVGYLVEIGVEGEVVYRERSGRKVEQPEQTTVLVSCLDPIVPRAVPRETPRPGQAEERAPTPAPMNIGPQPVWRTVNERAAPQQEPPPPQQARPQQPAQPPPPWQTTPARPPEPTPPRAAEADTPPRGIPLPAAESAAPVEPAARPEPQAPPESPAPSEDTESSEHAGNTAARGWFDEMPEPGTEQEPEDAESAGFGPTGEPTEIPYRYRS
ncbi:hypothetical protein [Amycolatopsis aidingensis]|uniref:hypothetical protein n=1 Tax=Amycolatopsis aidingensis TaxID=2842453 RepID=UPI001C0B78EE|nr:hypothetical protein [Amycolatopsis aidingensis]